MKRKYYYICLLILCITAMAGCSKERDNTTDALQVTYNINSGFLEGAGINFQIDDENAAVAGICDMDIDEIEVPNKINYENKDYPVVKVISSAFESDTSIVSFKAGDNITEIEDSAFYSCDTLKTIDLNNSVKTIGADAFGGCSDLKEVKGVGALTSISDNAFSACYSLEYIFISKNVESMGIEVFSDCEGLKKCDLEEGLTFIGQGMFTNCTNLSDISIPKSVTTINEEAFWGCSAIKELELPESLVVIGDKAFYDTEIKTLKLPEGITGIKFDMLDGMSELESITVPSSKESMYKEQFDEYGIDINVY